MPPPPPAEAPDTEGKSKRSWFRSSRALTDAKSPQLSATLPPSALAEPAVEATVETVEPEAPNELFTEERESMDLAPVIPLVEPERLEAVETEEEPAGFLSRSPRPTSRSTPSSTTRTSRTTRTTTTTRTTSSEADEDEDLEDLEELEELDDVEIDDEPEVSVLDQPVVVEEAFDVVETVEELDAEAYDDDVDESPEERTAERVLVEPADAKPASDDSPDDLTAERIDVEPEAEKPEAATAVLAALQQHDSLQTDPESGLMSYHSANAKRGVGLVAGAVAGLGGLFVAVMALQGDLVTPPGIIAGVLALVALLVFLRLGAMSSSVTLADGMLEVVFGDNHHKFDLTSDKTVVEMEGDPGDRDWRMMLVRRGLSPVEIDASAVDPEPFTEAMRQWRPNL